ncbi:LmeA family phospholipid-binding protein [Nocardia concava]|uniref:LmeA family phospholipid-binding protein n=1 Tax=Nocardia concava TaxID=257281 RepID=UPI000686D837|nr:LmeA family phospholipid-binding protein [Nocardia concava]
MRTLLIVLILICGLAVAADFGAAAYADNAAGQAMRNTANLGSDPTVHIKGFPFLLQVAEEKYDDVEVRANHVGTDKFGFVDVEANLHGAEVPFGDLTSRQLHKIHVDRLEATVRFDATRPLVLLDVSGLLPFGVVPTGLHVNNGKVVVTGSGTNVTVDIDKLKSGR